MKIIKDIHADFEAMDMLKDSETCPKCDQYSYSETDRYCPVCFYKIEKESK